MKMVRPNFGPPRFKARSYVDGPSTGPSDEHYNPHSRNRRDAHGPPGVAPPGWRDTRGRGRPPFTRRPPPRGGRREPPVHPWRPQSQNSFQTYSSQTEPHHGHRRPSPSRPNPRPNPPPPAQHRPSSHSPVQRSPSHRAAPFHRHPSGHRSPSPRHHHGHPPDRRAGPTPPYRGPFRGHKWQPSPSQDEGSWDSHGSQHSPRERQYEHSAGGGKRWNGALSRDQHSDEHGPSGSHRKPREFHGRGSYPERSRPSTSYHSRPQERQEPVPRKRRLSDSDMHPPGPAPEPDHSKRPRREVPQLLSAPKGFGGRPLSLRDKSRILKGRQTRGESVVRLRAPPLLKPKPPAGEYAVRGNLRSLMATPKPNAGPLKKMESRKPQQSLANPDRNTSKPSRRSDATVKEQETRRSLSTHRSSPIDKLSGDLVVVSHWQAGPSSREFSPTRESSKSKTERSSNSHVTSSSRFQRGRHVEIKTQRTLTMAGEKPWEKPGRAFRKPGPEHTQVKPWEKPGRPFRKPGPEHTQRPNFYSGPRRPVPGAAVRRPVPGPAARRPVPGAAARRPVPGPAARRPVPGPAARRPLPGPDARRPIPGPAANFRKPLMEGFVPRPFPQQKPAFRKSQSIMSKYRNMQSMRHRGPYNQGPNQQRW